MKQEIFRTLGNLEDRATEVKASLLTPLFKRRGIEVKLTRSHEERIEFLVEIFRRLNEEGGGIKEIKAALGGDDGDLDELAEALIRSGVVPPPGVEISRIRVKEVPIGPAPEEVRRSWVGAEMLAVKLPPESGGEMDFVTGESMSTREVYAVLPQPAIDALRTRSPKAADWFEQNLPKDLPALSFGINEVEVIASTPR